MSNIEKNQTYTGTVTGYSSTGAGVCRIMERAVFVDHALMGETWKVLILKVTSSAVYGKGVELLNPSTERREPQCPLFGRCGGCDLMHMSYDEEKRYKLGRVNDAISRVACLDFTIPEIIGADEKTLRYRNKAIYAVSSDQSGKAVTGFYKERSHRVVPVEDCLIQTQTSSTCAAALRKFMDENKIPPYDEVTGNGIIRHLFTRCSMSGHRTVACIVAAGGLGTHTKDLVERLRQDCPELTGIVLCVNKSRGNSVLAGKFHVLWGDEYIEDELCSLKFRISPESFFQINPPQAEKLYETALSYASPNGDGTVLDLYCGTGTIGLCIAHGAKFVYGAEIVPAAVENARLNARENNIENVEFICGDAGEAAHSLEERGVRPDAVVVDPPRKGLSEEVIGTICRMAPDRVVYVSCDPATLSRDMKRFSESGYFPTCGTAVDMFPRCAHVETVVMIEKCCS